MVLGYDFQNSMKKSNEKILDKIFQKANMEIIINVLIKEEMNIREKGEDA